MVSFQTYPEVISLDKKRSIINGEAALDSLPITISQFTSVRSAGGKNDFYSEGDYWWPDPANPDGPYIRKDGNSNPENFVAHRLALMRLSEIAGALGAAYKFTDDEKYAKALLVHLKAWFVNNDTKMNPHLRYAQAIMGKVEGRGIGIIDTIHLVEVIMAVRAIMNSTSWKSENNQAIIDWFEEYLHWLTSHPFGEKEKYNGNNHSTTFALQVAALAMITDSEEVVHEYSKFYKSYILPEQMDDLGRFPKEISRTKPYAYSMFNLDAMASLVQILTRAGVEGLYEFELNDGRSLAKGVNYLAPFLENKSEWPYQKDIQYWEDLPWQSPALLFSGLALGRKDWIHTWKRLSTNNEIYEIKRNTFVRYPVIWIE